MKYFVVLFFSLLLAAPTFAATRFFDLTGWATWVKPQSDNTFNSSTPNRPFNINFNGKLGYGIGANIFFGEAVSLSLDASEVKPDARFGFPGSTLNQGSIKMIPLTGVVQWHFIPKGFIDPYIGGGAAYVIFDNLRNFSDAGRVGVNQINFKDDVGFVANAGLGFNFSPRFGITGDVKYVPVKSSATAVFATGPNQSQKIKINPVMASAGLTLHF
jgi:outer membrane protein W